MMHNKKKKKPDRQNRVQKLLLLGLIMSLIFTMAPISAFATESEAAVVYVAHFNLWYRTTLA
jgi:hypothetical protein